ncbi:hypothetical protein ACEQ8H_002663 [Pleosporales sp. CAS-2024a]
MAPSPSPSPHVTKDKKQYEKEQRMEMAQIARGTISSVSSVSSASSSSSSWTRVQAAAIPTRPWPTSPHAKLRVTTWDVFLLPAQVRALYMGYLPVERSDTWFVFSEGPDVMGKLKVHLHRTSTGAKVAELFLVLDVKGEGAGKIVGLKWNAGDHGSGTRMSGDEARFVVKNALQAMFGIGLEDGH